MKKIEVVIEDLEDQIYPVYKFFLKKASSSFCSIGDRGYTLDDLDSNLRRSSIV